MIEAHWLFGVPRERIEIVIHPESIAPSLVAYVDGSVVAQVGHPRCTDIAPACTEALARLTARPLGGLDDAIAADAEARAVTRAWLKLPKAA